ncbi:MAG: lamin tail domain-containing protein [Ignavibacteria bacterium]|nr:lamin tail domain-containing protein [Ignavibacteria bacterium]
MKIFNTLVFFLVFTGYLSAQVVINEVMYSPASPNKEWFEIYNTGNTTINLQNWKWRDAAAGNPIRTITSQSITLDANTYAIICDDSTNLKQAFPGITGLIIQSIGWNALNNTGNENIVLYNSAGQTIDSLTYTNSWGGGSNISLERVDALAPTNSQSNWGSSLSPSGATPNMKNSISLKDYELILKSFNIIPTSPKIGEVITFELKITNSGKFAAANFNINIYYDLNFNNEPVPSELIRSETISNLNSKDSLIYRTTYIVPQADSLQFIVRVIFSPDQDTSNNTQTKRIYTGNKIVINEIMYDPLTGNAEWVELYNPTEKNVMIQGWKFVESSNNINISDSIFQVLFPGAYIIISNDTTIYNRFPYLRTYDPSNKIIIKNLSLSNDGETVKIVDISNNTIEEVSYSPKWHNPNIATEKGFSLERINPNLGSNDKNNWSSCADFLGGTPMKRNSIYTSIPFSSGKITISPNPFSPDGDGYEDLTVIKYSLPYNISQVRMKVFDAKGRLVRTLFNNQYSGSEGEVIFNGLNDNGEKLRLGIYIIFLESIDDKGGTVETIKSTVVVATKL